MIEIHDNHLVGYTVDGVARRIELRTERREPECAPVRIDVIFDGVEAYSFRDDCMESIVFGIIQTPLREFVDGVELTRAEALVLFEWLASNDRSPLAIGH